MALTALGAGLTTATMAVAGPAAAATPVAVWHMEETTGTTMVDSAGGNDGTLHFVTLGVPGVPGLGDGLGYGFSGKVSGGKSSYVSVPSADALNPGTADLTIRLSFKTTSLPAKADWDLARKGYFDTPGGEWKVELHPNGQASCGFRGSLRNRFLQAGPTTLADGQWHTVTCTKTTSSITLQVDGQTFSKSGKAGSIGNDQPVVVGAYPGKEFFKGTLDELSISTG